MDGFYSFNDEDDVRIDVYRLFFTKSTKYVIFNQTGSRNVVNLLILCNFFCNNFTFNTGKSNDNRLSHFGLIEEIMRRSHKK